MIGENNEEIFYLEKQPECISSKLLEQEKGSLFSRAGTKEPNWYKTDYVNFKLPENPLFYPQIEIDIKETKPGIEYYLTYIILIWIRIFYGWKIPH